MRGSMPPVLGGRSTTIRVLRVNQTPIGEGGGWGVWQSCCHTDLGSTSVAAIPRLQKSSNPTSPRPPATSNTPAPLPTLAAPPKRSKRNATLYSGGTWFSKGGGSEWLHATNTRYRYAYYRSMLDKTKTPALGKREKTQTRSSHKMHNI